MPINRPDGRHWCDPASEKPDENGQWTCPDCGTVWHYDTTTQVWEKDADRDLRLQTEAKAAEQAQSDPASVDEAPEAH